MRLSVTFQNAGTHVKLEECIFKCVLAILSVMQGLKQRNILICGFTQDFLTCLGYPC